MSAIIFTCHVNAAVAVIAKMPFMSRLEREHAQICSQLFQTVVGNENWTISANQLLTPKWFMCISKSKIPFCLL